MQSTNFEFMRKHRPDLADEGAAIERVLHGSPGSAVDLLRTFAERLLKLFLEATGKRIHDGQGTSLTFDDLLQSHRKSIPEIQRNQFDKLRREGNKQHQPKYEPMGQEEERKLLEVAWQLACWVGERLDWHDIPSEFEQPPEGGRDYHDMRFQRNEALKREAEAKRSYDVSGWICGDQRNIAAPSDFVGRAFVFDEMKRFVAGSDHRVLVIQGQPGRGKSAIIQRFLSDELPASISPFVFYFKDQESRAEPQKWVRHLYASLVKRFELPPPKPSILEAKPEDLVQQLRNRIEEVAEKHSDERLLFVIDGVDEAGSAEKLVWSFLTGEFPNTVQAIATTRPMHSSVSPNLADKLSLDLDKEANRKKHYADGREWVTATMPSLTSSTIDKVVQLSDANFLVLQGICRELREVAAPEIALRELSEHKALGKDLQSELYERTWKRLERLDAEELDRVEKLATLLACAPGPLSERIILDMLDLRRGDWVKVQQYFAEYLVESRRSPPFNDEPLDSNAERGHEENSKPVAVFRLFHQTLVEFVRQKFQNDLAEENGRLADYCCKQIGKQERASYEYSYALRFWPLHLCQAEKRWSDLEDLLTNIEFIEKKCKSGKVFDLVADFDLARRKDPNWLQAIANERRRQKDLENWAADVIASGTRWGNELRRAWHDPNAVKPAIPFQFPDPPDTSDLCDLIRGNRWDELSDERNWSESVRNLEAWRTFLTHSAGMLAQYPEGLVPCAANSSSGRNVREKAEEMLSARKTLWLEEHPRAELGEGVIPLPKLPVKATVFAISADGRRAATGEANGDVRLWNLVTGKCLHLWNDIHSESVSHVFLSVDGSRMVSTCKRGVIRVLDCESFRETCSAEIECEVVDLSCSPEGSVVAVACSDGKVRVADVASKVGEFKYERSDPDIETLTHVRVFPEQFCVVAFGERRRAIWDLITGIKLDRLPQPSRKILHELTATEPQPDPDAKPVFIG